MNIHTLTDRVLGIETTCDETSASVFTLEPTVLSNVVASQADLHAKYGGVVPEVASRAHFRQLLPVIDQALQNAQTNLGDLRAVAVAHTPGLVGAILVGLTAAKSLAWTLGIPLVGVNHIEGHIYACQMTSVMPVFPCLGLVISGGHTNLFACRSAGDFELIGATIDDAAGEAFDKVAALLGLGYPGGPNIERAAKTGDCRRYDFPRSLIHEPNLDFSFSGLKTAVLYAVHGKNTARSDRVPTSQEVADLAASFQQAVVDVVVAKCKRALQQFPAPTLCVGGGVAANGPLRAGLATLGAKLGVRVVVPPLSLCTDNAALTAVAIEKLKTGEVDSLALDAVAGVIRKKSGRH